jgi:hypothetical protein
MMTLTRPRLLASALCILIVLTVFYLIAASFRRSVALRSSSPALSVVEQPDLRTNYQAEPVMPAPPVIAAPPADLAPISRPTAMREAGPSVGPTAAPGVAFNYRYAFRLAATRVAEVQERHAQMCERLTVARCRITGMLYRVVNDRDIEAMLALKVDPAVARLFGREAVGIVVQSEGMLTESEISGTDAGAQIRETGRAIAELQAELARIEARLRRGDLDPGERSQADYDAQQLRRRISAAAESRDRQQQSLATTPMTFRYGSGELVPGFAPRPTLRQALQGTGDTFVAAMTGLLRVLISILPWALTLGLLAWIGARVRRRWFPKVAPRVPGI